MTAAVGEGLPPFRLTLTLQRLIMEAAANRDFAPLHIDSGAARASGAPDVYMNTTFIEAVLEATVRSWAGPAARIRMLEFAMKAFNCAGDVIEGGGRVNDRRAVDDGEEAELDIWIDGPRGRTVTGSAVVVFPG
jgi:acyl dehydratase